MNKFPVVPGAAAGVIERYREYLPVTEATPIVSLSEGSTPLIFSPRLSAIVGHGAKVYLKHEGLNPTGSFKDRGMTVAVSKAVESGARLLICASTGNTSAAAAAYAARAGIQCAVLLPSGKISVGKLAQAFVYGAVVIALDGNFDRCLKLVRDLSGEPGVAVVNSINPHRLEGQKTAAFEIIDALGDAPDLHLLPVGNAGNTTAYWRGYVEYRRLNRATRLPRMFGFEASGAAPIYYDRIVDHPLTAASAIRIGNPASWKLATAAFRESGGSIGIVTDDEIFEAHQWLASNEGLFVEPASAISVAALLKCRPEAAGAFCPLPDLPENAVIVCTLTGHGLKDTNAVLHDRLKPVSAPADKSAILSILENAK
ncbi:MAG TPA: threonine synthase [Chthoniobacterales bacterium]|nr:threonine synthase [Chthoniobacterales bacterium]